MIIVKVLTTVKEFFCKPRNKFFVHQRQRSRSKY